MDWKKVAENFESGTRFSKLFAIHCIEMLQIPTVLRQHRILDVAAGTGSFTLTLASNCTEITDSSILATDLSPVMIEIMRMKSSTDVPAEIRSSISFALMDAQKLEVPSDSISHLACVFGIMFFPDSVQSLREMHRVLTPGGSAAVTTWKSLNTLELMQHIAIAEGRLTPDQFPLPVMKLVLSYADPAHLTRDLVAAGFPQGAVAVSTITREHAFTADEILRALAMIPAFDALAIPADAVRRHIAAHPDAAGPDRFTLRGTAHVALATKPA